MKRAEEALRAGDLEAAKRSVMDAQEILPDDAGARTLAGQIIGRLEQQLREQKAAERQRQFALAVNTVEKAMADARMLLFLGQVPEALQALEKVKSEVAQLPPKVTGQFDALRKELLDKALLDKGLLDKAALDRGRIDQRTSDQRTPDPGLDQARELSRSMTKPWEDMLGGQTAEMPAAPANQWNATGMMQPGVRAPQTGASARDSFESHDDSILPNEIAPGDAFISPPPLEPPATPRLQGPGAVRFPTSETPRDVLFPRSKPVTDSQGREVPPELREFLEPEKPGFSRSMIWLGVAVVVLVAVIVWLVVRPKSETESHAKPPAQAVATANVTYAEINAEPWATVTALTPPSGDALSIIGQPTPLRVKLPPGQYTVTLQGPNHEQKQLDITVPQQGGATCFAVFSRPDLNRLVGRN